MKKENMEYTTFDVLGGPNNAVNLKKNISKSQNNERERERERERALTATNVQEPRGPQVQA